MWIYADSRRLRMDPDYNQKNIAADGRWRGVAGKYSSCDWAVVQLHFDGGYELWYASYGTVPVDFEAQ